MGAEPLPDLAPDLRQRWVEKWTLLALEDSRERATAGKNPPDDTTPAQMTSDQLARLLGAREEVANGN